MNVRVLLVLPFLLLLGACAASNGNNTVVAVSGDTYQVSYNAGFNPISWVEIKNRTLERADSYCAELGMKMIQPTITSNNATGLIPKEATTRFRCVPKTQDVTASN